MTRRKSEEKTIVNEKLHDDLHSAYIKIIKSLQKLYPVHEDKFFANLVNFKENKILPKHNWFLYKQGYAENLVKEIIKREKPSKRLYVLDPFAGVGTTNLVAQSLGYKSIGYDINPVALFASIVKTYFFDKNEIDKLKRYINRFKPTTSKNIPTSPLLAKSYTPKIFNQLMGIKGFYESIKEEKIKNFFKLAYLSMIEDCSNRIKDGNGIKIVDKKKKVIDAFDYFIKKSNSMVSDLALSNFEEEAIFNNASMTQKSNVLKNKKAGIVIFSPPYANCFDYCEVYKLELWMGGFVNNYDDFHKYRDIAIRSHVNSSFDHKITNENKKVDTIAQLLSCYNLWNKNIPDMIRGYFDDMTLIINNMKEIMAKGARAYIVVANSGYKGILVPTDLLLADIAKNNGFNVVEIAQARKIRASVQQMQELNGSYEGLMRESIIIIEKK